MPRRKTSKNAEQPAAQMKAEPIVLDESRIVNRRFVQTLPERLNLEERADFGSKLAAAQRAVVAEDMRQKSQKAELAAKLTEMKSEVARLVEVVTNGERMRDIECEEIFDLKANKAFVIRTDDGREISKRSLSPEERQAQMRLTTGKGSKAPKPAAAAPPAEG